MFKATLNQLNNHKTITTIPIREIKLYSSLSNVQFKIKINQEAIFSYCAPPATVKVKIDEQEMAYTINKINLKVSLIGSDKINSTFQCYKWCYTCNNSIFNKKFKVHCYHNISSK